MSDSYDKLEVAALFCTSPAIYGEVNPLEKFEHFEFQWRSGSIQVFHETLKARIEKICNGIEKVGVATSGGIDSYVVFKLARELAGKRVVPIVFNVRSDCNKSSRSLVEEQTKKYCGNRDIVVVDSESKPNYNTDSPHEHALTGMANAIEKAAIENECGVLLTGCGADEIILPPRFTAAQLFNSQTFWSAFHQQRKLLQDDHRSFVSDGLACIAERTGLVSRESLGNFVVDEMFEVDPTQHLTKKYRNMASLWQSSFKKSLTTFVTSKCETLAEFDALLSVWPIKKLRSLCGIPLFHPFQELDVVRSGLEIPFHEKFSSNSAHFEIARKRCLTEMLNASELEKIPTNKLTYKNAFREKIKDDSLRKMKVMGLLNNNCNIQKLDLQTRMMFSEIECWLT